MDLPPCGRGALVVPPSAAGIAGSRPGAMFWICRSSHGGFQFSALRAERLFTRPSGALQMCRLRQRRLPGPAPAGGPTSCAPKKSAEEGRSRGGSLEEDGGAKLAPLENPPAARVQPAAGRRLVPLRPTTAVGRLAKTRGGKQRPFRVFARSARVRGKAAQFSASPWALRATQKRSCLPGRTSGTVPETLGQRHCARGAAAGGMR